MSAGVTIRSTCMAGVDQMVQSGRLRVYTDWRSAATKTVPTHTTFGLLEWAIDLDFPNLANIDLQLSD